MTEQAGAADREAEEVVEQVLGLAQGNAEVSPAVTGQQAGTWADVGARKFEVAASLTSLLAPPALVDIPTIPMPLDLGFREIGHDMIFELASRFEIGSTAVGTLVGMNLVFGKNGSGWWLRPDLARMLPVLNAPAVRPHLLGIIPATARALAALMDLRECMFDAVQPASEFSVFRLELPQAESEPSVFRFQLGDT